MAHEKMLLDRLADRGGRRTARFDSSAKQDLDALAESVRYNIGRVLNARHGMCEALEDYGLPALSDLTYRSQDHRELLREAIRSTLAKYEPRLKRVRVTFDTEGSTSMTLCFRVDAVLCADDGDHPVWFETSMSGDGAFDVVG